MFFRCSAAALFAGASVNALQRPVEQLKLEAAVERIKASQAAAELQQYCMQKACKTACWSALQQVQPLPGAQILCFL